MSRGAAGWIPDPFATHFERRDDGSLAIGEIAARPPGANFVEMMGFGHETDMYRAWARAIVQPQMPA